MPLTDLQSIGLKKRKIRLRFELASGFEILITFKIGPILEKFLLHPFTLN